LGRLGGLLFFSAYNEERCCCGGRPLFLVRLPIVGVIWLIEPRQSLIELPQ
jgi:hypothetical protein